MGASFSTSVFCCANAVRANKTGRATNRIFMRQSSCLKIVTVGCNSGLRYQVYSDPVALLAAGLQVEFRRSGVDRFRQPDLNQIEADVSGSQGSADDLYRLAVKKGTHGRDHLRHVLKRRRDPPWARPVLLYPGPWPESEPCLPSGQASACRAARLFPRPAGTPSHPDR